MLSVMMMVVVMMTVTTTARSITMVENAGALHGEPRSVTNHDLTDPTSRSHLPIPPPDRSLPQHHSEKR